MSDTTKSMHGTGMGHSMHDRLNTHSLGRYTHAGRTSKPTQLSNNFYYLRLCPVSLLKHSDWYYSE